ncbi:MAG: hypothetical protein JXA25_19095 [Anaerolineales bacterium]|nr:hypothetical protein [Anaerolineales bacterium]
MAAVQETRELSHFDADQAYQAADQAFQDAGFSIWKRRPLGWIVLAKKEDGNAAITANAASRPGNLSSLTFSLESPDLTEQDLKAMVKSLFEAVTSSATS